MTVPAEEDSFDDFYRVEAPRLLVFVRYLGADDDEAEEVVQVSFTKLYCCRSEVQHPRPWLRTTAYRLFIGSRHQRRTERERMISMYLRSSHASLYDSPDICVDHKFVVTTLAQLPPRQRAVMALTFDSFTDCEIAGILGISEATVRNNRRHARRTLQRAAVDAGLRPSTGEGGKRA